MLCLKCISKNIPPYNEFTFLDKHTGKKILYREHTLDFRHPQDYFLIESISHNFAYQFDLQVLHSIPD